jgi:hypothetical protein
MVSADFDAYYEAQRGIDARWQVAPAWTRASILNVARMAWFSSDRTIREYAEEIWAFAVLAFSTAMARLPGHWSSGLPPLKAIAQTVPSRATTAAHSLVSNPPLPGPPLGLTLALSALTS